MASRTSRLAQTVQRYSQRLFRFIRSRVSTNEDAEDILQDVWYQLSVQPELEAIESVSGWLFRVARNRIIDTRRKKRPEPLEDFGFSDEDGAWRLPEWMLTDAETAEEELMHRLFWEELFAALEELPENQRDVFILNELEDVTLREIAERSGENLKTIISRKGYAVKHLRRRLQDLYDEIMPGIR